MSHTPSAAIGPDLRAALVAMVRKRVPESEVEDIVQATLADAIESPHAPQDSESLRRWIFGVAKNKVVDYHRRAGRETFEVPEVAGRPAPHAEADLLRWAEKHLPPGDENKTTLDWMLREGEGEKLEWIAESEKVPAPRVRQRVSRLRRHLKTHWQKEVALLAALGVVATILLLVLRPKDPEPIADDRLPRAVEMRKEALENCAAERWKACVDKLDEAKALDPAGDSRPEVKQARENANRSLTLPPAPSPTLAPVPSAEPTSFSPVPDPSDLRPAKPVEVKGKHAAPPSSTMPAPTPPPSWKGSSIPGPSKSDGFGDAKKSAGQQTKAVGKPMPANKTGSKSNASDFDSLSK